MKLVSFEIDGDNGYGLVDGETIMRLDEDADAPRDLKELLASGLTIPPAGRRLSFKEVRLLPPITNPGKILCVATNFHEAARAGQPVPEYPLLFTRFGDSLTGHNQPLIKSGLSEKYDFEGELAVIIGQPAFKVSPDRAIGHVAGYACLNDGSVRDWQKHSSQFTPGKNFYRSGSIGPWLVTADEIPDPTVLSLETRVNGTVMQAIDMGRMIFDIPWLIAYISSFTPLAPGDIIATGTPSGFGSTRNPPVFLKAGDHIEVEIPGVGLLHNIVQDEE